MDTNAEANYKVSFGRAGGTLVYEDDVGFLLFTFDCGPADKQSGREWNLHLGTSCCCTGTGAAICLFVRLRRSSRVSVGNVPRIRLGPQDS